MTPLIGQKLSHYEITDLLGEGGMGKVYRAKDTKLGREVAIKVLPEAFTESEERLARFEREARMLAALDHPNIAAIHEVGEAFAAESEESTGRPVHFLVMQLAEGETLAERLDRGPIPLEEALSIARQIVEGLEAAHDRGIVHRDLKPANVKVDRAGQVKLLDFGLAKTWEESADAQDVAQSPTLTAQMTHDGVILGTAGYMSPEQARGQEADRRSDVWSFGVVLHEMLTGERLFQADTVSDTLARVLMFEPDWAELSDRLPGRIRQLLERCLERDVKQRLQAIGEARIAIESFLEDPRPEEGSAPTEAPVPPRRALGAVAAVLAVALIATLGALWTVSRSREALNLRFAVEPPPGVFLPGDQSLCCALSSDGTKLVFVFAGEDEGSGSVTSDFLASAGRQLYLRTLGEIEPVPLLGTDGARSPFFSPDGEWVAFFTEQKLLKVSVTGGRPLELADARQNRGGTWSKAGTIAYSPETVGGLFLIPETGGIPEELTTLDTERDERTHRWPEFLPDGKTVIFTSDTFESAEYYDDARIEAVDVETGERKVLVERSSMARYSPTGHLLYARDSSIFAIAFDAATVETSGKPKLVHQGVMTSVSAGAANFDISAAGHLLFVPGAGSGRQWTAVWRDRSGGRTETPFEEKEYSQLALSPAGDRVVFAIGSLDETDLWVADIERGTSSRLTFGGLNSDPVWGLDGHQIYYSSQADGARAEVHRRRADGIGDAERIWAVPESDLYPTGITPNGGTLLVEVVDAPERPTEDSDVWMVDLTSQEEPRILLGGPTADYHATVSPNGRWVAYTSRDEGPDHIFVRPFPSADGRWQISSERTTDPRWSSDGSELFFRGQTGLLAVRIDSSETFRASIPETLFGDVTADYFPMLYAPSPDAQKFMMFRPHLEDRQTWRVHVHLNWADQLRKLMEDG